MYGLIKAPLLALLKAPAGPPAAPAGSPGSVRTFRASPQFLRMRLLLLWIGAGLPVLAVLAVLMILDVPASDGIWGLAMILTAMLVAVLAGHFVLRLDYDLRYYIVTDRSLRIREGAVRIRETTFTYANVQNLAIAQGPLERIFGIANLEVQTAGGGAPVAQRSDVPQVSHSNRLRGIDNAEEVRALILAFLKEHRGSGLGDPDDVEPAALTGGADPALRLREILEEARGMRKALGV